jgi:hypothetical protein
MKRMTLEEAQALDDLLTGTDPAFTNVPGVFAKQRSLLDALDDVSKNYIQTRSEAIHKPPAQIIGEMVRREIEAAQG